MSVIDEELLFVAFNQDATSLSVGSKKGYRLYSLNQLDELHKLYESELGDVCLVERLFSSSLVTVVSQQAPRKLRVCHFQKGSEICNHSYSNTILNVRLNRLRLVVCLEESLYIQNIRDMKSLHTIRDTPPNPTGLCELSPSDDSFLAYPGSSHTGEIQIFDAANLQAVITITAHDSPVAAMKFSQDGAKLATASEKGTVIRVFSIPKGDRLFEFRRGVKRCVQIYSLAFSSDSMFLSCSSNTETVHVFKLEHDAKDGRVRSDSGAGMTMPHPPSAGTGTGGSGGPGGPSSVTPSSSGGGWGDWFRETAAAYLPTNINDVFSQDRALATARLPHGGAKNTTAMTVINRIPRLLVASTDGYLYVYSLDLMIGGECALIKQHRLFGDSGTVDDNTAATTIGLAAGGGSAPIGRNLAPNSGESHATGGGTTNHPGIPTSTGATGIGVSYASTVSKQPHAHAAAANANAGGTACVGASTLGATKPLASAAPPLLPQSPPTTATTNDDCAVLQREEKRRPKQPGNRPIKLDDSAEFPPMSHHAES